MWFKTATILTVTLLSLQVSAQTASLSGTILRLSILRDRVTTSLNEAFITYRTLSEQLDSLAITTKSSAARVIRTYSEEYLQRFEDIKKSAADAKVNITSCLNYAEDELKNLGPENSESLVACIDTETDNGLENIRSRGGIAAAFALDRIFDGERQVVHCGEVDGECLYAAENYLTVHTNSMRSYLDSFLEKDSYIIYESFTSRIQISCSDRYTETTRDKGKYFIDAFEECVNYFSTNNS